MIMYCCWQHESQGDSSGRALYITSSVNFCRCFHFIAPSLELLARIVMNRPLLVIAS